MKIMRILTPAAFLFAASATFTAASATTLDGLSGIDAVVQSVETGGVTNPLSAKNSSSSAIGAFQITKSELVQIGYENADGSWNSSSGASSQAEFLSCQSCQVNAVNASLTDNWSQLKNAGTVNQYLGQTVNGITYNESALLECAYQAGAAGCANFLAAGGGTAAAQQYFHNANAEANIAAASEADSSAITGGNTIVDNSGRAGGGTVSSGTALAQMETYCASEVSALMQSVGQQEITDAAALAGSGSTGYTLLNGQGVTDALASPSAFFMDPTSSTGMMQLSCVDNLLNGAGINSIFTLPTLSQLLNQLQNAVCQAASTQMSQLMSPVSNELGQVTSMAQGGGFFPGLSLTSLGGSFSVGTGGGGLSTSGSTSVSVTSILNQENSWYASPTTATPSSTYFTGFFR